MAVLHIYSCEAPPATHLLQELLHAVRVGNNQDILALHDAHPQLINAHILLQENWGLTLCIANSSTISPQHIEYYTTPLIEATKARQTGAVELLVKLGAQLHVTDSWGNTAAYYAHLLPMQPACAYQALRLLIKKQMLCSNNHALSMPQPTAYEIALENSNEKP